MVPDLVVRLTVAIGVVISNFATGQQVKRLRSGLAPPVHSKRLAPSFGLGLFIDGFQKRLLSQLHDQANHGRRRILGLHSCEPQVIWSSIIRLPDFWK